MTAQPRHTWPFVGLSAICCLLTIHAHAPAAAQVAAPHAQRLADWKLVIGTPIAPPFAMKGNDDAWQGISIDLWRHVAKRPNIRFRLKRDIVHDLVDAVPSGR